MGNYSERLEKECAEIEKVSPNIKKIVDEILRIRSLSSAEFDYNIERTHLMYVTVKKISNCT